MSSTIDHPLWQKLRHLFFQHQNINHQLQIMKPKPILFAAAIALPIVCSSASAQVCGNGVFLSQLSANPFLADSTANKFGAFGSPYSSASIHNSFGAFGNPYAATSVSNPYATLALILCGDDE